MYIVHTYIVYKEIKLTVKRKKFRQIFIQIDVHFERDLKRSYAPKNKSLNWSNFAICYLAGKMVS